MQIERSNNNLMYKKCTKCGEILPLKEFGSNKSNKDKLQHYCKQCQNSFSKQWKQANKEYVQEYQKQWLQQFDSKYIYTIHDINGHIVYVGTTTNIYKRCNQHITGNSNISEYMVKNEWLAIKYIKLNNSINNNELRYIEQCFIDEFDPMVNINNACIEFDFIEGDRLAYLIGLSDSLIMNYDKIADIWKVNKNIA